MSAIGWPEVDRSTVVSITMLATSTRAISSTSKTTITRAITAKRPITPVSEIPADWVPPTPDTLNGKKEIESDVKASRPAVRVMTMGLSGLTLIIVRKAPGVSMFFEDIDQIVRQTGRLDVVVNNAGIVFAGAIEDTSIEEAKAQFETNLFGVLRVCRAA